MVLEMSIAWLYPVSILAVVCTLVLQAITINGKWRKGTRDLCIILDHRMSPHLCQDKKFNVKQLYILSYSVYRTFLKRQSDGDGEQLRTCQGFGEGEGGTMKAKYQGGFLDDGTVRYSVYGDGYVCQNS